MAIDELHILDRFLIWVQCCIDAACEDLTRNYVGGKERLRLHRIPHARDDDARLQIDIKLEIVDIFWMLFDYVDEISGFIVRWHLEYRDFLSKVLITQNWACLMDILIIMLVSLTL